MPTVNGINYTTWGGYADLDFADLGGVYMSAPRSIGLGFRLGMIGPQWVLVDPDGKVFIFKGMFGILRDGVHVLGGTNQNGRTQASTIASKYSGAGTTWEQATVAKLKACHFNASGPFSYQMPSSAMPQIYHSGVSRYARIIQTWTPTAPTGWPSEPVKDIARLMPSNSHGNSVLSYRPTGSSFVGWGDWLDPKWAAIAAVEFSASKLGISTPRIGYAFEESDCISRWMAGGHANERSGQLNDTNVDRYTNIHAGIGILFSRLQVTTAPDMNNVTVTFADTTNYSKAKLIQNLKDKYGTISALNAAWQTGGYYTSFDSAGGYGVGTGVADEDGLRLRPWFGSNCPTQSSSFWGTYHTQGATNNVVDSTSWGGAYPSPGSGAPSLTNQVKADLDQIAVESIDAFLKPVWDTLKARDPGFLFSPANNWGLPLRPAFAAKWNQYTDFIFGGSLMNVRIGIDHTEQQAIDWMNWVYSYAPKPHIVNYYNAPSRTDSCLYYRDAAGFVPGANITGGQRIHDHLLTKTFNFATTGGIYPHIGWNKWEFRDNFGENLHWGLSSLNDNMYDGLDYTAPRADPWAPDRQIATEDNPYSDYLGFGGSITVPPTLQRTDLVVGGNMGILDVLLVNIGNPPPPPPPDPPMATVDLTITLATQNHLVEYTGMRVRFQRSTDGGATYADMQSNVRALGTTTDQYIVPAGQPGLYRAGACLTDGTNLSTELFSSAVLVEEGDTEAPPALVNLRITSAIFS